MSLDVESIARQSAKGVARYMFHRDHGVRVKRAPHMLEKRYGRPDSARLRLAEAYAREVSGEVSGEARNAPWLRVYIGDRT